jgi:hypothetical protein
VVAGNGRQHLTLGRDQLLLEPERLVIHSPVDMLDWQVREFRKLRIEHGGRGWELVAKLPGARDTIRYELVPWPQDRTDLPGGVVVYDEAYVALRDEASRAEARAEDAGVVGFLLRPLIGLLPARAKLRLERRGYGSAIANTAASRVACWMALLLCGSLATVFSFAGGLGGGADLGAIGAALMVAGTVLLVDVLIRWSRAAEDPQDVSGFLEWLWTRRTSAALDSKHRADASASDDSG